MLLVFLAYAIAVSLIIPFGFGLFGPVRERRAVLGLTYGAIVVIGWCGSLTLAFLSPYASAASAALLSSVGLFVAYYSLRDELLLARIDARLGSAAERQRALDELQKRILEIGDEGPRIVALMEVAAFPIRRLLHHGLYQDALGVLRFIDTKLGMRLGEDDAAEASLLEARVLLHLGRTPEAEERLERGTMKHTLLIDESRVLLALIHAARGEHEAARACLNAAQIGSWASWTYAPSLLVEAHIAAVRGQTEVAIEHLHKIPQPSSASMLQLARAVPGPASELAAQLEHPTAPYR